MPGLELGKYKRSLAHPVVLESKEVLKKLKIEIGVGVGNVETI